MTVWNAEADTQSNYDACQITRSCILLISSGKRVFYWSSRCTIDGLAGINTNNKISVFVYTTFFNLPLWYTRFRVSRMRWPGTIFGESRTANCLTIRRVVRDMRARRILPKGWNLFCTAPPQIHYFLVQLELCDSILPAFYNMSHSLVRRKIKRNTMSCTNNFLSCSWCYSYNRSMLTL